MSMPFLDPVVAQSALAQWGLESQLRLLQEECAELIVAISHYLRGREDSASRVAEEMADVRIVLDQTWHAFSCERYMQMKVDRLLEKLDSAKTKEEV